MGEEKKMEEIARVLDQVLMDTSVPKNIRRSAEEVKNTLLDKDQEIGVRVSSAIYILEEISNDRNLPLHARTVIWNVASELETIKLE
ncbi:MAG: UPF0147 family protein [Candidatus Hydrothermarchaeaceae archaeon]